MATEVRVWGEGREGLWSCGETVDIPPDFEEVPTGDPFITRRLKQLSETVYVRMAKVYRKQPSRPVALLAPAKVVRAVLQEAERTAKTRGVSREKAAVRRDAKEEQGRENALAVLRSMLPGMPPREAEAVVERAFQVGSGRVGRSRSAELEEKLVLAVRAHIRHEHTQYDLFLAEGSDQRDARHAVRAHVDEVYERWRSGGAQ